MKSLIIIIVVTVIAGTMFFRYGRSVEGLTLDAVHNTDRLSVTNLNVTGEELSNYIRTNKLLVITDISNNQDVYNPLSTLNDLNDRVSVIEKGYVDKNKPMTIVGTGYDGRPFGLLPGTGKITQ